MDKSRVYFKNSILQKLDAIHNENGISDTEYWQLVQDVDQCEDLDTLKDMNDLVFLSNYISHIDSDILEMINESQVQLQDNTTDFNLEIDIDTGDDSGKGLYDDQIQDYEDCILQALELNEIIKNSNEQEQEIDLDSLYIDDDSTDEIEYQYDADELDIQIEDTHNQILELDDEGETDLISDLFGYDGHTQNNDTEYNFEYDDTIFDNSFEEIFDDEEDTEEIFEDEEDTEEIFEDTEEIFEDEEDTEEIFEDTEEIFEDEEDTEEIFEDTEEIFEDEEEIFEDEEDTEEIFEDEEDTEEIFEDTEEIFEDEEDTEEIFEDTEEIFEDEEDTEEIFEDEEDTEEIFEDEEDTEEIFEDEEVDLSLDDNEFFEEDTEEIFEDEEDTEEIFEDEEVDLDSLEIKEDDDLEELLDDEEIDLDDLEIKDDTDLEELIDDEEGSFDINDLSIADDEDDYSEIVQNTKQNEEIRNEELNNKKDNIGNPFNRIGAKNDIDKKRYQDTADFYNHLHKLGLKGAQNISSISKQAIDKAKQKKLNQLRHRKQGLFDLEFGNGQ